MSAKKRLDSAKVFTHAFTCQNFDRSEMEGDQKHDRAKSKALTESFLKVYVVCFKIFTGATSLVAS